MTTVEIQSWLSGTLVAARIELIPGVPKNTLNRLGEQMFKYHSRYCAVRMYDFASSL